MFLLLSTQTHILDRREVNSVERVTAWFTFLHYPLKPQTVNFTERLLNEIKEYGRKMTTITHVLTLIFPRPFFRIRTCWLPATGYRTMIILMRYFPVTVS